MKDSGFQKAFQALKQEVAKMIVGHERVIEEVLMAMFAGGHVLLEGVPGLGKTLLVRTISRALQVEFSRIQFTPDLMPADILGTNIVVDDGKGGKRFDFQKGPIFGNMILADEINRATPKTQSALLQAMEERRVTVARTTYTLPAPFFVLATQNPIEMEGTYPLPEAQLDRFMFKTIVETSSVKELVEILDRTTGVQAPEISPILTGEHAQKMMAAARAIPLAPHIKEAVCRIVLGTHPGSEFATDSVKKYVRYGSSPRGAQSITLTAKVLALAEGRDQAALMDIRTVALSALRHRIILNFEGEAAGMKQDTIINEVVDAALSVQV